MQLNFPFKPSTNTNENAVSYNQGDILYDFLLRLYQWNNLQILYDELDGVNADGCHGAVDTTFDDVIAAQVWVDEVIDFSMGLSSAVEGIGL